MSYIEKISYHLGERSEVPNQVLARDLANMKNIEAIEEIHSYLFDKNKSIASDCLKVLYEIGYIDPTLISIYLNDFIGLLNSKNNRMVWGSMIAIANISNVLPDNVYKTKDLIKHKIETGTTITQVWGIYALVNTVSANQIYYGEFRDYLFKLQKECRPIDFTKRAVTISQVVVSDDLPEFVQILNDGLPKVSSSASKKLTRLIKKLESGN